MRPWATEGKELDVDFTFARLTNTSGRAELRFNQSFLNDFGIAAEESPPNSRGRFLQSRSPLDVTMKITRTTPVALAAAAAAASASPFHRGDPVTEVTPGDLAAVGAPMATTRVYTGGAPAPAFVAPAAAAAGSALGRAWRIVLVTSSSTF